MSLGFAFEGCAGRAAFQAGVAAQCHEDGLQPACVTGASSGSIVAALVADGHAERLPDIWMTAAGKPVFQPRRVLRGDWPWAMSSIVGDALEAVFESRRLASLKLPIGIPVTFIGARGRSRRVLTRDDDVTVVEAVLASCFIPGPYSRWIRIHGRLAWDGAWDVRVPIEAAVSLGASRVLAVVANETGSLLRGFPGRPVATPERCVVVSPDSPLPIGAWDTDPANIRAALTAGRRAARAMAQRVPVRPAPVADQSP
jgi:predicted acylesterase/phospholipase RssA